MFNPRISLFNKKIFNTKILRLIYHKILAMIYVKGLKLSDVLLTQDFISTYFFTLFLISHFFSCKCGLIVVNK